MTDDPDRMTLEELDAILQRYIEKGSWCGPNPATRFVDLMRRRCVLVNSPDGSRELRITPEADQNPVDEPRATDQVRRRNDPALTRRIVAAHNAGHNQADIAVALHIHVQTVRRHLMRAGVSTRRAALTNNQLVEARQRKAAGWTLRQLAHEYGVAHTTIGRLLSDPTP